MCLSVIFRVKIACLLQCFVATAIGKIIHTSLNSDEQEETDSTVKQVNNYPSVSRNLPCH